MRGRGGGYSRGTGYRTTHSRWDSGAGGGGDVARRGGLLAVDGGAGVVILGNADAVGVVAGGEGALVALPTTPPSSRCPRPAVRAGARPLGRGGDVAPRSAFSEAKGGSLRVPSTPWGMVVGGGGGPGVPG